MRVYEVSSFSFRHGIAVLLTKSQWQREHVGNNQQANRHHSYAGYLEYVYIQLLKHTKIYSSTQCKNGFNVKLNGNVDVRNPYNICDAYNLILTKR